MWANLTKLDIGFGLHGPVFFEDSLGGGFKGQ